MIIVCREGNEKRRLVELYAAKKSDKILYPINVTLSLSTEDNNRIKTKLPNFASDFQCFVCGAIFTTDEDRKQHLEKEALGILLASSDQEIAIAKSQGAINENRRHHF